MCIRDSIFSCLLSVNESADKIKSDFSIINQYAHEKGFESFVDVSPKVFDKLNISYQDLTFFKEIGADGIRLDAVSYTHLDVYKRQDLY